jgi:hypothetical protein
VNLPPTVKYTLGRIGLFVLVFLAMLLVPGMSLLLKLMIAILASFGLQFVLLGRWRREMIDYIDGSVQKSKADKAKLRAALAGDEPAPSREQESADRPREAGETPAPEPSDREQGNADVPRPGQSAE